MGVLQDLGDAIAPAIPNMGGLLGGLGSSAQLNPYATITPADQISAPSGGPTNAPQVVAPNDMTAAKATSTPGPAAASYNIASDPFVAQQRALASNLADQAAGRGPSVAANQLKAAQEGNIASQFALANSGRGGNQAGVARQALTNAAQTNGALAQQSATARLQEQQAAAGTLNNVLGTASGQQLEGGIANAQLAQSAANAGYQGALQTNLTNAGYQQQAAGTNYQGALSVDQQNAQLAQAHQQLLQQYAAMGMDAQKANQLADLQVQQLQQQQTTNQNNQAIAQKQNQNQTTGNILQGLGGFASGAGSFFGGGAGEEDDEDAGAAGGAEGAGDLAASAGPLILASRGGQIPASYRLACGGDISSMLAASGGSVPGQAVVAGDSPKNDFVHALLSPGEIVIPRSHSGSPEAAADFVRALHGSMSVFDKAA